MPARKVDIDLVKVVLQRNELETRQIARIIQEISEELDRQDDEVKLPAPKKQFAIVVSDTQGHLQGKDLVGWVAQLEEGAPVATVVEKIIAGAYDYNASPKGRRLPVESIGEACEHVSPKFFKDHHVWIKTKEPVQVVTTDNQIPKA